MSVGLDLSAAATKVAQSLGTQTNASRLLSAVSGKSTGVTGAASAASTATAASTGSDISSNDFLTLLVTEMKNQDPTQPTDPNAYIQQLVGVNSLQQLIAINQDLSNVTSSTSGTSVSAPTSAI